ncbi:oligosaccharide flippase family protein [Alteromonas sp. 5E99-2]|uniref:oligosaccharide flippase family protein n=1 Tax=Alteromonas sp. 5E99-2 TaxID=2817683 RepID=UPI001A99F50E|nr:oligosaccharide flippase family protein [Alteromonas sp. 5E99-2]MBO1254387.1 oligosaccharide flippase family protein [Alteromonas sp. 5E99-2]
MSNLKKTITSSFLLSFQAVLKKLVGLISTLILARMLVPEDFGIIAIALMTMGLLEAVKEFGGASYLMRSKEVTEDMLNTTWTLSIILSATITIILVLVTPLIVNFFEDERLYAILWVYSSLFLIKGSGNPATVFLKREQNYLPIVKLSIFGKVISVVAAVAVALIYQNYWALVVGQYVISATVALGSFFIHPYRPKFSLINFKEQWNYSGWWLLQSILGYCKSQLDTFLVSTMFSKAALGSYYTMKYLASIPTTYLIGPSTEPLLVQLAKIKDSGDYFFKQYNISLIVPLCIAIPGCIFLFANHQLATLTVLGDNWIEYSELFAIFCTAIVSLLVQQHASRIFVIHGKTKGLFYYQLISFIIIYSYLIFFDLSDLTQFSTAKIALEFAFSMLFFTYITIKYTSFSNYLICLINLTPIIAASLLASYGSQYINIHYANLYDNTILQFIAITAVFGTIYFLALLLQAGLLQKVSKEWHYIWDLIMKIKGLVIEKLTSNPTK